ncbi:MAG: flagellar biosynthesis anti-sigma factor FlgM [Peptococcaceae bacterium]|nr:flagellar biosynthesis anti-sigma factor FlgM [Peptococcaceae bacterium]
MKIDGTSISPIGSVQAATKVSQINKNNNISDQDKLAVSENAQVFQKLVQKVKDLPEVREDKVKEISDLISRGEFSLDADSIAASMLSQEKIGG